MEMMDIPGATVTTARRTAPPGRDIGGWRTVGLGALSLALLWACLAWVHGWGPTFDILIPVWFTSLVATVASGAHTWAVRGRASQLACIGLVFASLSLTALVYAGVAFAFTGDGNPACGGG
jgi:hypothetical protein